MCHSINGLNKTSFAVVTHTYVCVYAHLQGVSAASLDDWCPSADLGMLLPDHMAASICCMRCKPGSLHS